MCVSVYLQPVPGGNVALCHELYAITVIKREPRRCRSGRDDDHRANTGAPRPACRAGEPFRRRRLSAAAMSLGHTTLSLRKTTYDGQRPPCGPTMNPNAVKRTDRPTCADLGRWAHCLGWERRRSNLTHTLTLPTHTRTHRHRHRYTHTHNTHLIASISLSVDQQSGPNYCRWPARSGKVPGPRAHGVVPLRCMGYIKETEAE